MVLTNGQTLVMILAVMLGTMITRFVPFILFPDGKKHPPIIDALSQLLPAAMMGLLVVYCLKEINFLHYPYGIPELLSVFLVACLHIWRRNVLLSITIGTIFYMFLLQKVFV